jgi:hypothetical protein
MMELYPKIEYYCGSIRIKNPKTLQRWIDKGWYQKEIDAGYIFAPACGRFRVGKCECSKCKRPNSGWMLKEVLESNGLLNNKNYEIPNNNTLT